ncbi:PHD finger protein rhinoceros [Coccinella septempunctata]|uniref:PHD finger protein rhinoceros n=1 Tax=Coccinella septempunctata TaxID=41139 RepID=UPI001D061F1E|nr:PHD finger protein rhinoceros [Coccinella septempunctata]XP_044746987.1 PHD finger protein rhinoceros [Coccinella septempunctata]XP_044746995.1 PHD finger protein rhinoceros [Coccinella septempunctata]XP_044747002.1 PHD finger protein rhinoceros [Coccinella septempunctata]XP_044747010.1 PHD finger protein rhinoceros [Coccinella septempunctata]XP_044747019.1 PHD finger protein rhinoceros [Coccinella septempunctata]
MSQRIKRPNRSEDGFVPVKRRKRMAVEDEEAATLARIYNRNSSEAPAELFRKDLISAMKLPDSEPLSVDEYWIIQDQWKQEWERGVQVPVNPDSLPEPSVSIIRNVRKSAHEFKLPKNKYIRITRDENFKVDEHVLSNAPSQAEDACSYDLDENDVAWLKLMNAERATCGLGPVHEDQLERVIERFEMGCWEKIQTILRNEEGLGIEFDENVICDVCRSPDSEEGNEMVFCDSCNICVHQACYGITRIPEGQWLCCTCNLAIRPKCVLCPNKGGAMKCTRSGQKWAHVSCALWIPEVSIGCVEKMEPITKISSIPASRWALICVLCRERVGACIQCSVKTCKTAYHVTCAFKHGLEMRAIIEDENADDGVKLRSYCEKHSKSSKKEKSICSGSEDDDSRRRKRKDMTSEEKNLARAARLQEIESEFYKFVSVKDISINLNVDQEALTHIYNYWKLKRKSGHNKPLLPPKTEDIEVLALSPEDIDTEKLKTFVQLRQDLERVRNLCYMVTRREKLSRSLFRLREQTFLKQTAVLESGINLPSAVINAVIEANHGPSIYDRLYSHDQAQDHSNDFELLLARIQGLKSPTGSGDEKKPEVNGLFKDVKSNPYKKVYFNGSKRRSSALYSSMSSASSSSSDEKPKENKENRVNSTSDDEKPVTEAAEKKLKTKKQMNRKMTDRRKKPNATNQVKSESSSEDDIKPPAKKQWCNSTFNRSKLSIVEHQLGLSATDSDDLMDLRNNRKPSNQKTKISSIYSDSDSSDSTKNDDKSANNSDSQQKLRTKASVKEFSNKPSTSKATTNNKNNTENKKKTKQDENKKENSVKKKDYVPSDLIVPQRQAAKKASENLKNNTIGRPKDSQPPQTDEIPKVEEKCKTQKQRVKSRDTKEPPKVDKHEKVDKVEKSEKLEKSDKCDKVEKDKPVLMEISENEKGEKMDTTDLLAYVPQRQAAKKAAEHIKSGLGKPAIPTDNVISNESDKVKKDNECSNKNKKDVDIKTKKEPEIEKPAKITETKRKSSSISSSSSSSSYSSGSSSSSSSSSDDDDDESEEQKPRSESLFSVSHRDQAKRANAKDRPFLDKGSKSATSSSSTSDSGNSTPSSASQKPNVAPPPQPKAQSPQRSLEATKSDRSRSPRKSTDKKLPSPSEREESKSKGKAQRGRSRPSNTGEVGSPRVGTRDLSGGKLVSVEKDGTKNRKRKQSVSDAVESVETTEKAARSSELLSPVREKDKKLNESPARKITCEHDKSTLNLEKEILERKASKENKSKSTLDRLFGPIGNTEKLKQEEAKHGKPNKKLSEKQSKPERLDKPVDKHDKIFKENKEHPIAKEKSPKKSPCKNQIKTLEDPFTIKPFNEVKTLTRMEPVTIHEKSSDSDKKPIRSNCEEPPEVKRIEEPIPSEIHQSHEKEDNIKNNMEITALPGNINRSIFSPQPPKESDLLDFDNFDDSLGISKEDDILRPFTFNPSMVNNDDTREENVRETLNLVEKLRLGLSKKPTGCEVDDTLSIGSNSKHDDRSEFLEQVVPDNVNAELPAMAQSVKQEEPARPMVSSEMKVELTQTKMFDGHNQNYQFMNCQADVSVECNKNIPIEQHQGLPDTLTTQGDERWVPPSDQNYSNLTDGSHHNFMANVAQVESHNFLDQYSASVLDQEHHKKYPEVNNILADVGARLQEEVLKSQSHLLHGQRISQPLLESIPDNTKFPELHMHPPSWPDNAMLPNRRSSSSSAASSISSTSRRNDTEEDPNKLRTDMMVVNPPPNIDISLFPSQTIPTFQPNPLEPFAAYSEASQFVNPVSLFAGPNLNTQLAYPSAGPAGFPPAFGAPFPTPHVLPPIPKPEENIQYPSACTAAFTSSQHNMALTAAMVNLPTKEIEPSLDESIPICQNNLDSLHQQKETIPPPQESPIVSCAATSVTDAVSSSPSQKSTPGKKSPSKPTRSSARVTSQLMNKSPNKSPGKSPRQQEQSSKHGNAGKRDGKKGGKGSAGKNTQYQGKGRGRGRGRARPAISTPHMEYDIMGNTNTIQKLVGTVYDLDFDDEWNETADLKSMRERRKSVDTHEKKADNSYLKDSMESPKFSSPLQNSHKNRSYADLSNLRPPTPFDDSNHSKESEPTSLKMEEEPPKSVFPDIVPPFLPGPVDMRTYNSNYEEQKYESTNLLQAFAAGTTENQVHEGIDEEYEKELHAALMCKEKSEQNAVPEISNIKVSLSDSRNQLKVKIKGPIANYTSTVAPLPPPMVDPIVVTNITSNSVSINVANSANASGTSNLRRMRKKELLRQYWSQDMSTDDPSSIPINNTPADPIVHRTVTIPKAVTSVTSIPTKEDYRDYRTGSDDFLESKQHKKEPKVRSALTRELRQLDLSLDDETLSDRRRGSATGSNNTSFNESTKRRGRPPRTSTEQQPLVTPKLKIKIGNNSIISSTRIDDKKDKIKPPKKRISNIPMPSVEDLKRESMKYRKMVMAGFGEEKEKKKKKDKSEKKKKKKKHEVEIISSDMEKPTKLIIRFNKKTDGEVNKRTSVNSESVKTDHSVASELTTSASVGGESSSASNRCSPPKVTPIKLKLSRCQEGSAYIMKPSVEDNSHTSTQETPVSQPGQPPPQLPTPPPSAELSDAVHPPPDPLPLNKDCEVR